MAPICFLYNATNPRSENISADLWKFYFGDNPLTLNNSLTNLSRLYSDALTGFAIHRFVHLAARSTKVYYYEFAYRGSKSHIYYPENEAYGIRAHFLKFLQLIDFSATFFKGVVHHDDLMYLFVEPSVSRMFNDDEDESSMVNSLTRMFSAFAYKG